MSNKPAGSNPLGLSLLIPLLTIYAVSGIYYHELGYFKYYNIPVDFIQIELFNSVFLIFILLSSAFFLILLSQPITAVVVIFKNGNIWFKLISCALLLGIVWINSTLVRTIIINHELLGLIIALVFGIVIVAIDYSKQNVNQFDDWFNIKIISKSLGMFIGYSMIVCSISSIIMFNKGFSSAKYKNVFAANKHEILLRKYSSFSIYGVFKNKRIEYFVIKESNSIDTIHLIKIK